MTASIVTLLIPLWILLGLLALFGVLALVGRIQNGRYIRPIVNLIAKVPIFRRWLTKASQAALERTNPELASAMKKLEPHAKHMNNPQAAQKAMSKLTREERRAVIDMQEQQGELAPEATNRQMRRRIEQAQKSARRRGR